jgi:hypothetical protein
MVSAVSGISSVLQTKYGLNDSTNLAKNLLSAGKINAQDTQTSLLSSLSGTSAQASRLETYITENVQNNESLLADLQAIEALSNVFSAETPNNSVFYNSYQENLISLQQADTNLLTEAYNPVSLLT